MRKLILKMSISIDGFVGGPNGEIDWIFGSMDEGVTAWLVDTLWLAGVHIMGSRTYQDMAAYWPSSTEPFAAPMNEIPKVVFSRKGLVQSPNVTLTTAAFKDATRIKSPGDKKTLDIAPSIEASWIDVKVASGDLAGEISRLKQQTGKAILAHGGAGFARSLVESGLIDEYRLLIHPAVLGRGLSLFSGLTKPRDLKLVNTTVFGTGAVAHIYRPVA